MIKSFASCLFAVATLAQVGLAQAQQSTWPAITRIVVPFSPGASNDIVARMVAKQLAPRLGSNVIVENRAGASGMIGAEAVAKGPKDGSMLLLTSGSLVTTAATMRTPTFDVTADLVPAAMLADGPLAVVVSSKTGIKSPADLLTAARATPDALTAGTAGVGGITHMAPELLNDAAKLQLRSIPYKGGAPAIVDLASGTVDLMIGVYASFVPQIQAGRVRMVAVTSRDPSPAFPGVPTMASAVPGYEVTLWTAVFVPAGTPAAVIQRLNRELNEIAKSKELRDHMLTDGATPMELTSQDAAKRVKESYTVWKQLATAKSIVTD